MASLLDGRIIVSTAAGVRISGGKLRIYDHGTNNLTPVFSDLANATPLTNPVVADSAGVMPQIFGADGTIVDCAMLTAGDVPLSGRDWIGVLFGGGASGLSYDFTNSRYAVRGSGGIVYVEAGDASPDAVGGQGVLGGWAGTQADAWTVNAVAFNVIGNITENSRRLSGIVTTAKTAFTAAASIDIPLTQSPTGVCAWEIDLFDTIITAGVAVDVYGYLSFDGGGTYKTGASDYYWRVANFDASYSGSASATAYMALITIITGAADRGFDATFRVKTVNSGNGHTTVRTQVEGLKQTTLAPLTGLGSASSTTGYGRATHLRLAPSSGTFSGSYRVAAVRGTGD